MSAGISRGKKIAFALVTLGLFLVAVEGVGQVVWAVLEHSAFRRTRALGAEVLRNDTINFMKVADGRYGYTLKPGFAKSTMVINAQGFAQRDTVPVARRPGVLRVVALGESTTQGHNVDVGNYPIHLKRLLQAFGTGFREVEVINGGVSGWVSDQIALFSEHEIARYRPDVVVLYAGWNDFQSYDPLGPSPSISYFTLAYGGQWTPAWRLRSVELLGATWAVLRHKLVRAQVVAAAPGSVPLADTYRFYLASLDRIVRAFQGANPDVKIAVCTLVGRWPHGTLADYTAANGRVWWMQKHDVTPAQAADALERFNGVIRQYAASRGLTLVDAASAFAPLDRRIIQWDFAHMSAEGYELLAEVIYRDLREAGVVSGRPSPRLAELMTKFKPSGG